jgi:hypothetical protein
VASHQLKSRFSAREVTADGLLPRTALGLKRCFFNGSLPQFFFSDAPEKQGFPLKKHRFFLSSALSSAVLFAA